MIYDGHAYCFPPPSRNGGFANPAEFWRHLQLFMAQARQQPCWAAHRPRPTRRHGHCTTPDRPWRFDGLRDAAFRTGDHGLVEWTVDGEDYVKQALPPWTVDFAFPADSLVAEMNSRRHRSRAPAPHPVHGSWATTTSPDCCQRHPGRIQGLAHVPEWWFPSRTDDAVAKLQRAILDHGLSGLQFMPFHRPLYDLSPEWTGPDFDPLWATVAELGIPVFFTLGAANSPAAYLDELHALRSWMDRFPDIDVIMTHGFSWRMFADEDQLHVPDAAYLDELQMRLLEKMVAPADRWTASYRRRRCPFMVMTHGFPWRMFADDVI